MENCGHFTIYIPFVTYQAWTFYWPPPPYSCPCSYWMTPSLRLGDKQQRNHNGYKNVLKSFFFLTMEYFFAEYLPLSRWLKIAIWQNTLFTGSRHGLSGTLKLSFRAFIWGFASFCSFRILKKAGGSILSKWIMTFHCVSC